MKELKFKAYYKRTNTFSEAFTIKDILLKKTTVAIDDQTEFVEYTGEKDKFGNELYTYDKVILHHEDGQISEGVITDSRLYFLNPGWMEKYWDRLIKSDAHSPTT